MSEVTRSEFNVLTKAVATIAQQLNIGVVLPDSKSSEPQPEPEPVTNNEGLGYQHGDPFPDGHPRLVEFLANGAHGVYVFDSEYSKVPDGWTQPKNYAEALDRKNAATVAVDEVHALAGFKDWTGNQSKDQATERGWFADATLGPKYRMAMADIHYFTEAQAYAADVAARPTRRR